MDATLSALGERYWLVWLACIIWAALWAFLPDSHQFVAWPVVAFVAAVGALAAFDHLYRYAPLQRALNAADVAYIAVARDRLYTGLLLLSLLLMTIGFWVLDLTEQTALPLIASVSLPGVLKRRKEEVAFMASRHAAN